MDELLEDWPVRIDAPVSWGQMDAFAHVNNIVYFRWFEDVRFALFDRIGWAAEQARTNIGPILARTQCVFKAPVVWPDTVAIATRVEDLGEDRFTMLYRIVSQAKGQLVAEGDGRIVSYDYSAGAKAPIPPVVRDALATL